MDHHDFPFCPAEAGEALDIVFFAAHPERNFTVRGAWPGEVDTLRALAGEDHFLEPGQVGFIVARRYGDSIIRFPFAVEAEDRDELAAEAASEESCRAGYFRFAHLRAWWRVIRQLDWSRTTETVH